MYFRGPFALLFVAFVACKPHVGSSCDQGEARCVDAARALACEAGHFIETPCRGKGGCRLEGETTACDVHGDKPGDACSTDDESSAVCADPKSLLACHGGRYVNVPCRGEHGCVEDSGHSECDESIAESGEACANDGKKSCSADGKRVLVCVAGHDTPAYACRGEHGCRVSAGHIDCDVSTARGGDACDAKFEGTFACTEDKLAIVRCTGEKFVPDDSCKHGQRCVAEPGSTRCAKPNKL